MRTSVLHRVMDLIILYIFILEIVIKMVAEGNHPLQFFADGWNVFDFLIVAVGLMPFGGNAITALRLVRLLRVLKLVRPPRVVHFVCTSLRFLTLRLCWVVDTRFAHCQSCAF